MTAPQRVILWFRNDLRLTDNYIIVEAARRLAAKKCSEIVPVYCLDPRHFGTTRYSAMKTGPFRAQFLLESVSDLKRQLQSVGSDLLLFHDEPERVLPRLMAAGASTEVLAQHEVCSEELRVDRRVQRAIKPLGGTLELIWGATMYHKDDLPFNAQLGDMPDVFTPFKERYAPVQPPRLCTICPLAPSSREFAREAPRPQPCPDATIAKPTLPSTRRLSRMHACAASVRGAGAHRRAHAPLRQCEHGSAAASPLAGPGPKAPRPPRGAPPALRRRPAVSHGRCARGGCPALSPKHNTRLSRKLIIKASIKASAASARRPNGRGPAAAAGGVRTLSRSRLSLSSIPPSTPPLPNPAFPPCFPKARRRSA